jgi:RHS repeat-associated protein
MPVQLMEYKIANNYATGVERTNYLYDGIGRLRVICDPLAPSCSMTGPDPLHTTLLTYDTLSRVTRRSDPDRGQWTYRYRGDGAPIRQTDSRGVTTTLGYDSLYGRLKTVDWSADGIQDITYVYGDELGASAPPNSKGRLRSRTGPTSTLELAYDTAGRVLQRTTTITATGDDYPEIFAYDWRSRVTSHTYPDNETIIRSYDVMGLDRIESSARTYMNRLDFNAELNATRYTFGNGEVRTRTYYAQTGYLRSIQDLKSGQPAAALNRSYAYDLTGLVSVVRDAPWTPSPCSAPTAETLCGIAYDGLGRLTGATRGGSQVLADGYDTIGNLIGKEGISIAFLHTSKPHAPATDPNPAQSLYRYDPAGNMTMKDGRAFGYDALNRLISASGGLPTSYEYDDSTERVTKQVGSDRSVFLGPDIEIMNRVRLVKTIRANGEIIARVETLLPGGSGARSDGFVRRFRSGLRDVPDELLALTLLLGLAGLAGALQLQGSGSAPGRAVASGLAALLVVLPMIPRQARAAIKGDVTNDNRVDAADLLLLLRHVNEGVALPVDPGVGDVAPWSSGLLGDETRNSADLLVLTRGITEPDLDADGLSPTIEALVGTSPLVADSDGDGTADDLEDFDQDGSSNRDELLAGTDATRADTDGDGIVDGRDARPTQLDGERAAWVHTDHLGSVSVLSDETGTVVRRISYGVWGEVRSNAPTPGMASLDSAEKYTGQRYDAETSLYYYGARYYDPSLGRFMGADAVIASQYRTSALHPYAYVESNPLNNVDPSGNLAAGASSGGSGFRGWHRPDRNSGRSVLDGLGSIWQDAFARVLPRGWAGFLKQDSPAPQSGLQRPIGPQQPFQAQALSQADRRVLLAVYAEGLSGAASRGDVTSKEALAMIADYGGAMTEDPGEFVDDLGWTVGRITRESLWAPSGEAPAFGDSGFREDLRDGGNQVRHFAGGLVAGARYEGLGGAVLNTGREFRTWGRQGGNAQDIALGNRAAGLGARIMTGNVPIRLAGNRIRRDF